MPIAFEIVPRCICVHTAHKYENVSDSQKHILHLAAIFVLSHIHTFIHTHITDIHMLACIHTNIHICDTNKYSFQVPHMQINSSAHIRQSSQYKCLIWTHWNQQWDQECWYTYTAHYWHVPLNKYGFHITHTCFTALLQLSTYDPTLPVMHIKCLKVRQ